MNDVFGNLLDVCVVVYLDDILIYSDNLAEHEKHVREVLTRLHKHSLYTKAEKCEFHVETTEFLGYILMLNGLQIGREKVQTIQDRPEPWKARDIQSFLSFANFYRQFIHSYSDITVPLTQLTWKGTPWDFTPDCRKAFETLKMAFTTAPILLHWIPDAPLVVFSSYPLDVYRRWQTTSDRIPFLHVHKSRAQLRCAQQRVVGHF